MIDEDEDNIGLENGDAQITIDIGALKDIDHTPANIKQLSKYIGDQIEGILKRKVNQLNSKKTLKTPNQAKALHGQPAIPIITAPPQ